MNQFEKIIHEIKEKNLEVFSADYSDGRNILVKVADNSDHTIISLVKWRNLYGDWFDSKFNASFDNTKKWLNKKIFEDNNRVLFLIIFDNQRIGQFGLDCYDEKANSIFITDVIRGERGFAPGLMSIIFKEYIKWIQDKLKISTIKLRVFQDDEKAIQLYEKCGFKKIGSISLTKQLSDNGWKWIEVKKPGKNAERYFDVMEFK